MSGVYFDVKVDYKAFDAKMRGLINDTPKAVDRGLKRIVKAIHEDFDVTDESWENRAEFVERQTGPLSYRVSTDNEIYGYVERGTPPHTIYARRAPFLVFKLGSSPKTMPNILASGPGMKGSQRMAAKRVEHPGIKARNFRKIIIERHRPTVKPIILEEIRAEITSKGLHS